uniref:Epididymal secretory glutathione peroxidase n=1 Tax=Neovison vison TaxID=452646 RepID=A0A8C7B3H3_NEOVI
MTAQLRASLLALVLLAGSLQTRARPEKTRTNCYRDVKGTIYDYEALTLNRNELIQFKQFAGKLILLVNVATYCGLTAQYPGTSVQGEVSYLISSFLRRGM